MEEQEKAKQLEKDIEDSYINELYQLLPNEMAELEKNAWQKA
jgi:hypothetical protein